MQRTSAVVESASSSIPHRNLDPREPPHAQAKVLVFFSTCKQVKFAFEAFRRLRPGVPLRALHGKMKQLKRMAVFYEFSEAQVRCWQTVANSTNADGLAVIDRRLCAPVALLVARDDHVHNSTAMIHHAAASPKFMLYQCRRWYFSRQTSQLEVLTSQPSIGCSRHVLIS